MQRLIGKAKHCFRQWEAHTYGEDSRKLHNPTRKYSNLKELLALQQECIENKIKHPGYADMGGLYSSITSSASSQRATPAHHTP